ncbi:MAG: LysR family transcriptional regulator [Gemmatimonadota bacterium]|nr:MAG: LysR family transcriptional regulator [Gemmatimonadota bacterium]
MKVKSKIWLEKNGQTVFGSGRAQLLEAIGKLGSIKEAAAKTGISYRRARSYIKLMEMRLDVPLVYRTIGGEGGGGAELSKQAMELIQNYRALEKGIHNAIDQKFQKIFCE